MSASRNIVATSRFGLALLLAVSHLLLLSSTILAPPVASFATQSLATRTTPQRTNTIGNRMTSEASSSSSSSSSLSSDKKTPEIAKQLERAKAALAKSRAKMEAQERASLDETDVTDEEELEEEDDDTPSESLPFFAAADDSGNKNGKKNRVIKNKNEEGLFTTDGDLMAKLSEEEEWESRPLLEVFQNEKEQSSEAMNIDRDIAQSMFNLRKSLQTEDFQKIFDKRNRFIGDA